MINNSKVVKGAIKNFNSKKNSDIKVKLDTKDTSLDDLSIVNDESESMNEEGSQTLKEGKEYDAKSCDSFEDIVFDKLSSIFKKIKLLQDGKVSPHHFLCFEESFPNFNNTLFE